MRNPFLLILALLVAVPLVGCTPPDSSGVPEAWTKTPDAEKLEKIKKMPISSQMKIDGIRKLNVSEEEKEKAIAEIRAAGETAPPQGRPL